MVLKLDTAKCSSEEAGLQGVNCKISQVNLRGCKTLLIGCENLFLIDHLKNLEGKVRRESPKGTISTNDWFRLL